MIGQHLRRRAGGEKHRPVADLGDGRVGGVIDREIENGGVVADV